MYASLHSYIEVVEVWWELAELQYVIWLLKVNPGATYI